MLVFGRFWFLVFRVCIGIWSGHLFPKFLGFLADFLVGVFFSQFLLFSFRFSQLVFRGLFGYSKHAYQLYLKAILAFRNKIFKISIKLSEITQILFGSLTNYQTYQNFHGIHPDLSINPTIIDYGVIIIPRFLRAEVFYSNLNLNGLWGLLEFEFRQFPNKVRISWYQQQGSSFRFVYPFYFVLINFKFLFQSLKFSIKKIKRVIFILS